MKAMILAAGLGTRLKPLTETVPKALIEVGGIPMLERIIVTLRSQGFDYIIVNVHHFSDKICKFLSERDFGVEILISDESDFLLDTGGGIAKAYELLFKKDNQSVLIHNVDIISNADLRVLIEESEKQKCGMLLVGERDSSRKLIFNEDMELVGWHDVKKDLFRPSNIEKCQNYVELAFSGIYTVTKSEVEEMLQLKGENKYSIIDYFLHENRKESIRGIKSENLRVIDIGKPATLLQARELLKYSDTITN